MKILSLPFVAAFTIVTAFAHYTWVSPVDLPLVAGKSATVRISHGHKFPNSEEAINASQVDMFVLTPSGGRVKLIPAASATAVNASYAVTEAGLHRIAFIQDRGVSSRTPQGVRPGGRDKNPSATQAYRTLRTAVAYAATTNAAASTPKPLGLEFELTAELSNGTWQLQLLKRGKPVADAPVEVFLAGAAKSTAAGKTGPGGRLSFKPSSKGPAMFFVEIKDAPPQGAAYDSVNLSTSLYVSW